MMSREREGNLEEEHGRDGDVDEERKTKKSILKPRRVTKNNDGDNAEESNENENAVSEDEKAIPKRRWLARWRGKGNDGEDESGRASGSDADNEKKDDGMSEADAQSVAQQSILQWRASLAGTLGRHPLRASDILRSLSH